MLNACFLAPSEAATSCTLVAPRQYRGKDDVPSFVGLPRLFAVWSVGMVRNIDRFGGVPTSCCCRCHVERAHGYIRSIAPSVSSGVPGPVLVGLDPTTTHTCCAPHPYTHQCMRPTRHAIVMHDQSMEKQLTGDSFKLPPSTYMDGLSGLSVDYLSQLHPQKTSENRHRSR